jgi:general secretion pathway protein G
VDATRASSRTVLRRDYEVPLREPAVRPVFRVALAALCVSVLAFAYSSMPQTSGLGPSNYTRATHDLACLDDGLSRFEGDLGRLPTVAEGLGVLVEPPVGLDAWWRGPYVRRVPVDPWGRAYLYRVPPNDPGDVAVLSVGPDGKEGTADDIVVPRR